MTFKEHDLHPLTRELLAITDSSLPAAAAGDELVPTEVFEAVQERLLKRLDRQVREASPVGLVAGVPFAPVGPALEFSPYELGALAVKQDYEIAPAFANRGTFTIEPLEHGFGYTFGNSLRRVLLSSLAGAAVTSVRIEGVAHEFSTIDGVKEDVTDIVLNLKEIVCRMPSETAELEVPLVVSGPGEVTAGDIELPSGVEIFNPDAPIAVLGTGARLEVYLTIGHGRGYSPAEDNKTPDQPIGTIPIDSIFSPVKRVAYEVESARVGQRTDYDKLTLDIETDGSLEPGAALREAAEILIKYLAIFSEPERVEALREAGAQLVSVAASPSRDPSAAGGTGPSFPFRGGPDESDILIEELELGVRSYNCLKRAGVQTVGDLVLKTEAELNAIPNFGRKSIEEIKDTLDARGLSLRG